METIVEDAREDITRILSTANENDPHLASRLLPLVYEDLRNLAHRRLDHEPAGLTLQATALVHEAYLRLMANDGASWANRGHFFAAAAESMRRILIERARKYTRKKHGGEHRRIHINTDHLADGVLDQLNLLALDDALTKLEQVNQIRAKVVSLRYFAGLTIAQTAEVIDLSPATVSRHWTCAKAWLSREILKDRSI